MSHLAVERAYNQRNWRDAILPLIFSKFFRFCAANVPAEWFISVLAKSYHLDDFFEIEVLSEDEKEPDLDAMEEEDDFDHYSLDGRDPERQSSGVILIQH